MKITVATRVRGGFAIISTLLVALGVVSIIGLNSVGKASEEVSELALPTVSGTSSLKASFLNMGRLSFEGFVSKKREALEQLQTEFSLNKTKFESSIATLNEVVKDDAPLSASVNKIELIYQAYVQSSERMFDAHLNSLNKRSLVDNMLNELEANADDAASLLVDFSDVEFDRQSEVSLKAAELGNALESNMNAIISAAVEFSNTETLKRADIRKNEVKVILDQLTTDFSEMVATANGSDDSGTIAEVSQLMTQITATITSNDGLLATKISQLEQRQIADQALTEADAIVKNAVTELDKLTSQADAKALNIKEAVFSTISTSRNITISVVLISILLAVAISYVSVKAIIRPLARVNKMLKVVSSGDLTRKLDDSSNDEFGELSKNCNQLIDNLKELIHVINERANQLAAASAQTSTVTNQTTTSIEDQKGQISQIAAATTQMYTTSELVSQSADNTLKEIKAADEEAEKVKQISNDNKTTIEALEKEVEQAAEVINKLHQDSASIGSILDVIRGVADQTNLLALNAAIEAARAGEQGRGFAVVADEVRTLASRTQESTQEINSMIEVLQAGAEKAVNAMNQGKEQTVVCVEQTEKAGQALNQITDAVHRAYEVSARIEEAAKEQHTVSSQISERLESIVGIAEHTTIGAQQTAESSAEVAKLAEELQESVSKFKV